MLNMSIFWRFPEIDSKQAMKLQLQEQFTNIKKSTSMIPQNFRIVLG